MIVGIIQARLSSTRLPGKVLKPILGQPMIARQIERLQRVASLDSLVVATSNDSSDDPLQTVCEGLNVPCYRGSLDDVLDRFYQSALSIKPDHPDHIVRLTGDCPLADPDIIDKVIQFYLKGNFDYASNTVEPSFPDGLDAEVFSFTALQRAWQNAKLPSEREHVTPYLESHPSLFSLGSYREEPDNSHLRWTVDEPADFEFVTAIFESLYKNNPAFTMNDILTLLRKRPELSAINSGFERNAGAESALLKDREYLTKEEATV